MEVKRNREGLYQLISTVSDERYHDEEWITEDEAKKILIERAYFRFIEDAIKIDMEFPGSYTVNDKRNVESVNKYNEWALQQYKKKPWYQGFLDRFEEIKQKFKLEL